MRNSTRWCTVAGTAAGLIATMGMAPAPPSSGPAAEAGPPPPPGMELRQAVGGPLTVGDARFGQLSCSTGKVILGGGARIRTASGVGGDGDVKFAALQPFDIGDTGTYIYSANAYAKPGYAKPWALDLWALCGPKPAGYQQVKAAPASGVAHKLSRTVNCPAGKKLLAVGGMASYDTFDERGRLSLGDIKPAPDGTSALVSALDDATDGSPSSSFTLYARGVCATDPTGYKVVPGGVSPFDTTAVKLRRTSCPTGRIAYSAGFAKVDADGHAYPDGAIPELPDAKGLPHRYAVRAEQKAPLRGWSFQSFVICANPIE